MQKTRKKRWLSVCLCLAICLTVLPGHKEAQAKVKISAESGIVMDVQSGTILYSKNIDKKEYPASITKVMTALVAIENSSLSETVTFSYDAVMNLESGASNIGTQVGEKMTMEECLYAILLMSANEVCNGVAEHIAGSIDGFIKMMNNRAKELGCTGTHFVNANGLWKKNHYTTAHDMALIARAAYKNPTFAKITGTKRYNIPKTNKAKNGHALYNHHGMLYASTFPQYVYEYCVGGKTGYTSKCRYTLVTFAKKDDMTLVSVIMKAPNSPWVEPNEYTDSTSLLNSCFESYSRHKIRNETLSTANDQNLFTKFSPIYNSDTSPLSIDADAGVILPKGVALNKAQKKVDFYESAKEGADGEKIIGKLTYTYNGKEVGGSEIYYSDKGAPTLKDSIDMSEWFDDAVEKANQEPFPWKTVIVFVLLVLALGATVLLLVLRLRSQREQRNRKTRYKRTWGKTRRRSTRTYYHRRR